MANLEYNLNISIIIPVFEKDIFTLS